MLTVEATAKVNLTLEVLGKRPDGFHEIRSVMQSVSLCDVLSFGEAEKTTVRCDMAGWSVEKSLVNRAVNLLREATGYTGGAAIEITKKIPLVSGMGGDSSDTAAVIIGLNKLWKLGLSLKKQSEVAAELGSDVPFFLRGRTALATGRGEVIAALPSLPEVWVVLVVPDVMTQKDKTAKMYRSLAPSHYTDGKITERLVEVIKGKGILRPEMLFNTFENVAFQDDVMQTYREHLIKLGAFHVNLVGSGPTLFTVFNEKIKAEDIYNSCKNQGMEAYLVKTL